MCLPSRSRLTFAEQRTVNRRPVETLSLAELKRQASITLGLVQASVFDEVGVKILGRGFALDREIRRRYMVQPVC